VDDDRIVRETQLEAAGCVVLAGAALPPGSVPDGSAAVMHKPVSGAEIAARRAALLAARRSTRP
jgi:hypothetical protein